MPGSFLTFRILGKCGVSSMEFFRPRHGAPFVVLFLLVWQMFQKSAEISE